MSPIDELKQRIKDYDVAIRKKDRRYLETLFTKDGVFIVDHAVVTRKAYIDGYVGDGIVWKSVSSTNVSLRVYGDCATEVGHFHAKRTVAGKADSPESVYSTFWIRQNGTWKIATEQSTDAAIKPK